MPHPIDDTPTDRERIEFLRQDVERLQTLLRQAVPFMEILNFCHHSINKRAEQPSGRWLAAVRAELGEKENKP